MSKADVNILRETGMGNKCKINATCLQETTRDSRHQRGLTQADSGTRAPAPPPPPHRQRTMGTTMTPFWSKETPRLLKNKGNEIEPFLGDSFFFKTVTPNTGF